MRALGITIADILEALSTDRSNAVIGLVAAVPGAYGKFTGLSIGSEKGAGFHVLGDFDSRKVKRGGRQIDMENGILPHRPALDPSRGVNEKRNHHALVIAELLAPCVTDSMVGDEKKNRVFKFAFFFQAVHDLPDLLVHQAEGVQVSRPIFQHLGVSRIVGRKRNLGCFDVGDFLGRAGLRASLASAQADLGEKRLSLLPTRPFSGIKNGKIPFEIIIGLPQPALVLGINRTGDVSDGAQTGVIPCLFEKLGNQFYLSGFLDLHLPPSASVVVSADAGLEHSGDEGRTSGRTDRSGDRGIRKAHPVLAKFVQNGRLHQSFAIETIVLGLILDHDPQNIGQWPGGKGRKGSKE